MEQPSTNAISGRKFPSVLVIFLIIFVSTLFGAGLVLAYQNLTANIAPQEVDNGEVVEQPEEEKLTEYSGKFFEAKLPKDWSIKEYEFKDKPEDVLLVEGPTYSGFAQLSVFNTLDKKIFTMYAVHGIGGTSICADYHKFSDHDPAHLKEHEAACDAASPIDSKGNVIKTKVIDTVKDAEFNLLSHLIRRSGTDLFTGKVNAKKLFEIDSINTVLLNLKGDGISFDVDKETSDFYFIDIVDKALSSDDLEMLDKVLASLTIK